MPKNTIDWVDGTTLYTRDEFLPENDISITINDDEMNVETIIQHLDEEVPNKIENHTKLRLLYEVEGLIQNECILTHEVPEDFLPVNHFMNWSDKSTLYAQAPYHVLYIYYLAMRIAQMQNDTKRYNFYTDLYNNAMLTYQQWYHRTHTPLNTRGKYYDHTWQDTNVGGWF